MHSESNNPCHADSPVDEAPDRDQPKHKRFVDVADALEDAKRRANEIEIGQPILDLLYGKTRWISLARAEWERQVRVATAFDENLTRFGCPRLLKQIANQVATPFRAAVAPDLTSAPTLAITYHGGFSVSLRRLFGHFFPEGVVIAINGRHPARNGAFALFAGREALLAAKPVFMAPDGRFGKETATVSVLGAQLPLTDGAPFLAHVTGCRVIWFALRWTDHGFAVEARAGPPRQTEQPFREYRERFYQFYAARLEEALTGDPASLPLTVNWKIIFGAMLDGKVYRARRPTRQIA